MVAEGFVTSGRYLMPSAENYVAAANPDMAHSMEKRQNPQFQCLAAAGIKVKQKSSAQQHWGYLMIPSLWWLGPSSFRMLVTVSWYLYDLFLTPFRAADEMDTSFRILSTKITWEDLIALHLN